MPQATFVMGGSSIPIMINHTATTPVSGGDIIPVSSGVRIAHRTIDNGTLGAVAAGQGVYDVTKVSGVNTAIANGALLYWNDAVSGAVSFAASTYFLGQAVSAVGVSDVLVRLLHLPDVA